MATNYEILMSCTRKQMAAFINSLVKKEVSRYIDWNAWLLSEDPEPPYVGEAAFMKEGDAEIPCYLLEETTEENGERVRTVFMVGEKGDIRTETLAAHFVRRAAETIYPAAPLPELSDEEVLDVMNESESVLETLLSEAEEEADALDQIINESMSEDPEEELITGRKEAEEEEPEEELPALEEVNEEPEAEEEIPAEEAAAEETVNEEPAVEEPVVEEPEEEIKAEPEETKKTPESSVQDLDRLLFGAAEDDHSQDVIENEAEDVIDLSVLEQLENEVMAADKAEDEKTTSLRFDDLWSLSRDDEDEGIDEETEEPEAEEDEVVDFFEEQDRAAAASDRSDYYSRGRIEMLKESLFDDEDEPPLNTGDLVFMETTAIQLDRNKEEIPEAADLDEAIRFADVKVPKQMTETAKKAESTSSIELGADEEPDSFFEKLKDLSEAKEDKTAELNLDQLKKESEALMKDEDEDLFDVPRKTPEEEELDLRSDTLVQLLIDKKKTSMLYDPNDPEDQELPTIAFSALNTEEDQMF